MRQKFPFVIIGPLHGIARRARSGRLEVFTAARVWMTVLNESEVHYQCDTAYEIETYANYATQIEHSDDKWFTYGH